MEKSDTSGIIGAGNMGSVIAGGLAEADDWADNNIYVYDIDEEKMKEVAGEYNLQTTRSAVDLADKVDFVILAVKPSDIEKVLDKISGSAEKVVSIAAGVRIRDITRNLSGDAKVIRVMPNTPCQVKKGMSFIARSNNVQPRFLEKVTSIFESLGKTQVIKESLMDSATALGGSGPAYIFYFLEALREAGVYLGLDSKDSLEAALQVMQGAAKMVEKSEKSPGQLRQEVSSPGGTTVEALKYLDERGARGIFEEALCRARDKSEELGGISAQEEN